MEIFVKLRFSESWKCALCNRKSTASDTVEQSHSRTERLCAIFQRKKCYTVLDLLAYMTVCVANNLSKSARLVCL